MAPHLAGAEPGGQTFGPRGLRRAQECEEVEKRRSGIRFRCTPGIFEFRQRESARRLRAAKFPPSLLLQDCLLPIPQVARILRIVAIATPSHPILGCQRRRASRTFPVVHQLNKKSNHIRLVALRERKVGSGKIRHTSPPVESFSSCFLAPLPRAHRNPWTLYQLHFRCQNQRRRIEILSAIGKTEVSPPTTLEPLTRHLRNDEASAPEYRLEDDISSAVPRPGPR